MTTTTSRQNNRVAQIWASRNGIPAKTRKKSYPDHDYENPDLLTGDEIARILKILEGRKWCGFFRVNHECAEQLTCMEVSNNRKKSPLQVRKIANDLAHGRFDVSPDAFAITPTGEQAHGCHRVDGLLRAAEEIRVNPKPEYVKIKDLEICVMVYFNYPQDAMGSDNGTKPIRTHEAAAVSGIPMTNRQSQIARRLLTGIDHRCSTGLAPTSTEIIQMFQEYRETIKCVEAIVWPGGAYHYTGARIAELGVILTRARIQSKPVGFKRIEAFIEVLRTGGHDNSDSQKQVAVFGAALHSWKQFKDANREWLYALVDRAFYNYVNGILITRRIPARPNTTAKPKELTNKALRILDNTLTPMDLYTELFKI